MVGQSLGAYQIVARLGEGGMGEVYRARDTKLGREVAIKILPAVFALDAERVARFKREAQVLAALNHPHIAQIYGLEEVEGVQFLVMELVDGESLDSRIARGAIPVDEALPIAKQIAEALEAAHEKGIIHRDLKPANIAMTKEDGQVKVLDFGLAKAFDPGATPRPGGVLANSPTITSPAVMTATGVILGTAAYMSPEQVRGSIVDCRADLWAFGVVLYEMLTGRRLFDGATISDTLASVLKTDPAWTALSATTPAPIRRLLRRCLEKDRKRRLDSAATARLEIDDAMNAASSEAAPTVRSQMQRSGFLWAAAGLMLGVAITGGYALRRVPQPAAVRFQIDAPSSGPMLLALSPDGRFLAFRGPAGLEIRPLDRFESVRVGAANLSSIVWSPDSQWVGFVDEGKLKKVTAAGTSLQVICDTDGAAAGAAWNAQHGIVFASGYAGPLLQVSPSGGTPVRVTELDTAREEIAHVWPQFLPDGDHVMFIVRSLKSWNGGLYVTSLSTHERKRIADTQARAVYASNHLLFVRDDGTLVARTFDVGHLAVSGDAIPIADNVMGVNTSTLLSGITASDTGVLAYRPNLSRTATIQWFDRAGQPAGVAAAPGDYSGGALSPEGDRLAVYRSPVAATPGALSVIDLSRQVASQCTAGRAADTFPAWSPDGRSIAFSSSRTTTAMNIYVIDAGCSGSPRTVVSSPNNKWVSQWSPDGRYVVFDEQDPVTKRDVKIVPADGGTAKAILSGPYSEAWGNISPDGRWLAYASDESGKWEVYVQRFPELGHKVQISNGGGTLPRWRRDGRELFYQMNTNAAEPQVTIMAADIREAVSGGTDLNVARPHVLFSTPVADFYGRNYDATPDGTRFIVPMLAHASRPYINVVLNWAAALPQ